MFYGEFAKNIESEKNNFTFKLIYAIGIIFVVAGHCKNGGISIFYEWFPIYSFHLALFMFSSGYFYKEKSEENILGYIGKKIKRLVIPLYVWNIIYGFFVQFTRIKGFAIGENLNLYNIVISPWTHGQVFEYNLCLWYVATLFLVEVFNIFFRVLLKKVHLKNEYIVFCIYLVLGMIGMYSVSLNYIKGAWLILNRFLYFLPFYGFGILYKRKLEKYDTAKNLFYFATIIIIQLIIIIINKKSIVFTVCWLNDMKYPFYFPILIGFTGIAFWFRICKILTPALKDSKTINIIANNTYAIMTHQFIGFFTVKYIFGELSKVSTYFKGFDWYRFKTDIWYYFIPQQINQWLIIYLMAGIFIPILISYILKKLKSFFI